MHRGQGCACNNRLLIMCSPPWMLSVTLVLFHPGHRRQAFCRGLVCRLLLIASRPLVTAPQSPLSFVFHRVWVCTFDAPSLPSLPPFWPELVPPVHDLPPPHPSRGLVVSPPPRLCLHRRPGVSRGVVLAAHFHGCLPCASSCVRQAVCWPVLSRIPGRAGNTAARRCTASGGGREGKGGERL